MNLAHLLQKQAPELKPEDIIAQIQNLDHNLLKREERAQMEVASGAYITRHGPTRQTITSAKMLAERREPVLIIGPTGTGKELIANILHCRRAFNKQPLIAVNCAGLTDTLFESLLFGHVKGAFTGAVAPSEGHLRAAREGTVFFDEVGELPPNQQAKLLRAIQTNKVTPVGESYEVPIHCRFIFATWRQLGTCDSFRRDLFYRISRFVLHTYPLTDRPDDIIPIITHICAMNEFDIGDVCDIDSSGKRIPPPPETYATGNVRQLENYVFRRVVLGLEHAAAIQE